MTSDYIGVTRRRNVFTHLWALLAAMLVNVGLFIVMPMLQAGGGSNCQPLEVVPDVDVVHVRPEPHDKPKVTEARKVTETPPRVPHPSVPQHMTVRPHHLELPFKMDPALQLSMPTLGTIPVAAGSMAHIRPQGIFPAGDLDNAIGVQVRIPPIYPLRARERRVEGWVRVRLLVDEKGRVERAEVVEARPSGYFERSVLNCVKRWKLTPPTVAGRPVKTWVETRIRFRLED